MEIRTFALRDFQVLETVNQTQRWKRSYARLELLVWKHPDAPYGCALVWGKDTLIRSKYDENPDKLVREALEFAWILRSSIEGLA